MLVSVFRSVVAAIANAIYSLKWQQTVTIHKK